MKFFAIEALIRAICSADLGNTGRGSFVSLSTKIDSALTEVLRASIVAEGTRKSPGCGVGDLGSNVDGENPPGPWVGSTGSICSVGGGRGPLLSSAFPGTFRVPNGLAVGAMDGL